EEKLDFSFAESGVSVGSAFPKPGDATSPFPLAKRSSLLAETHGYGETPSGTDEYGTRSPGAPRKKPDSGTTPVRTKPKSKRRGKADETGGGAKWLAVVAVLVVGALAGGWFFLQPLWQPTPSTRRDGEKPGELHRFTDHKKEIFGLAFSGDGQRLVAACLDQTASIWNVESGEKERIIPGFRGPLTCAAWPAKQPRVLF